jgi:hypothetical protein
VEVTIGRFKLFSVNWWLLHAIMIFPFLLLGHLVRF